MESPGLPLEDLERLEAARGGQDIIAQLGQPLVVQLDQEVFVVDEKYAFLSPARGNSSSTAVSLSFYPRQVNREQRALAGFAFDPYGPAVALHDAVDHGQSQAGPLPMGLGGKKRIEYLFDDFGFHTAAGVVYLKCYIVSWFDAGKRYIVVVLEMISRHADLQHTAFLSHSLDAVGA